MNNRHCTCFIISYSGTKPTFEKPKVLWAYNHRSALLLYGKSAVQLIFGIYQDRSAIRIEPGTVSWFAHYKNSRTLIRDYDKKKLAVYDSSSNSFTLKYNATAYRFVVSDPVIDVVVPVYGHPIPEESSDEDETKWDEENPLGNLEHKENGGLENET